MRWPRTSPPPWPWSWPSSCKNAVEHAFPSAGADSVFIGNNEGEAVGHVELVLASDA